MVELVEIPVDALVLLVGAAGSGKSTLAARLFPGPAILASDAIRAELTGDPANQAVNPIAFRILHERTERRLADGLLSVIDATNLAAHARRPLIRLASAHGRPVVAIVLQLPDALCLERNAGRPDRVVPEAAVRRQLGELSRLVERGTLAGEGITQVVIVSSPAGLDQIQVGLTKAGEPATLSASALPRRSRRRHP